MLIYLCNQVIYVCDNRWTSIFILLFYGNENPYDSFLHMPPQPSGICKNGRTGHPGDPMSQDSIWSLFYKKRKNIEIWLHCIPSLIFISTGWCQYCEDFHLTRAFGYVFFKSCEKSFICNYRVSTVKVLPNINTMSQGGHRYGLYN